MATLTQLRALDFSYTHITDDGLRHVTNLNLIETVVLTDNYNIRGPGLEHLGKLRGLKELVLRGTSCESSHLRHLQNAVELTELDLGFTQIGDEELVHLTNLRSLRTLMLDHTKITNASVPHIAKLTQLRELYLNYTSFTLHGVRELQEKLPECTISSAEPGVSTDPQERLFPGRDIPGVSDGLEFRQQLIPKTSLNFLVDVMCCPRHAKHALRTGSVQRH